jgi:predicted Rossmann fold flavoprotein
MKKVIVVGGGAAGLVAAATAASHDNSVTILEKNDRVGKKINITGKGRCNITNNVSDIKELISNIPCNGKFLYSCFSKFSNHNIIQLFNDMGVQTKVERGGRVFPVSDTAQDVVNALVRYNNNHNVEIKYKSSVSKVISTNNRVNGVLLEDGRKLFCDAVILCTGGSSYPGTGSTGDGYKIAKNLGHSIAKIRPSLVPLNIYEEYCKEMEGLSLKNVSIKIKNSEQKVIYEDFGEMIFTWFGVSGPLIISASSHIADMNVDGLKLIIDLKPALNEEKLDERILRDFAKHSRKCFKNVLDELLPQKMIPVVLKLSGIDNKKEVNQITKEERKNLINILKNFSFTIAGLRNIKEAIITRGGISIGDINPSTMESKIIKGLFFAGEIIDVDGYTGGYNLTIAFSTGYVAGLNV